MWARARYHLRLTSQEFWRLTPRQYHLLWEEHREHLVHTEMVHAWTTAAVHNSAPFRREGVSALQYMPSHRESPSHTRPEAQATPQQLRERSLFAARVAQAAAEMRRGGGKYLDTLKQGKVDL